MDHIFLFGHRKQVGKNFCGDILGNILTKNNISYKQTYFAKLLKQQVAQRYGLSESDMEFDEYKKSKPSHLNGLSVRDVLIKEGCLARSIWENTWAFPVYNELLTSNVKIGIITDFRYPNEFNCFNECLSLLKYNKPPPKLHKILVYNKNGIFLKDGSDDQLPDIDNSYWNFTVVNEDYTETGKQNIEKYLENMLKSVME